MYELILQSALQQGSIGLVCDEIVQEVVYTDETRHSAHFVPQIASFLVEQNVQASDIKQIAVVTGPGSFTGIRVGVTIAKTWALMRKIPVKSIPLLLALAYQSKKPVVATGLRVSKHTIHGAFWKKQGKDYFLIEQPRTFSTARWEFVTSLVPVFVLEDGPLCIEAQVQAARSQPTVPLDELTPVYEYDRMESEGKPWSY